LYDQNGKNRIGLRVDGNIPSLALFDQNGKNRIGLRVDGNGPILALFDQNEKLRTGLRLDNDGPSLDLYDQNEKARAIMGTNQGSTPDGKTISCPESSLVLIGPKGKVLWEAP